MREDFLAICPTATCKVLLRLYYAETNDKDALTSSKLLQWWLDKLEGVLDQVSWMSEDLWRLYARHLHALVSIISPSQSGAFAQEVGIEYPGMPRPVFKVLADGSQEEYWTVEGFDNSFPPFEFYEWQKPLKIATRSAGYLPTDELEAHSESEGKEEPLLLPVSMCRRIVLGYEEDEV